MRIRDGVLESVGGWGEDEKDGWMELCGDGVSERKNWMCECGRAAEK